MAVYKRSYKAYGGYSDTVVVALHVALFPRYGLRGRVPVQIHDGVSGGGLFLPRLVPVRRVSALQLLASREAEPVWGPASGDRTVILLVVSKCPEHIRFPADDVSRPRTHLHRYVQQRAAAVSLRADIEAEYVLGKLSCLLIRCR